MERHFLERVNAQNLQSSVQSSRQVEFLVEDCHYDVDGYRDPDLRLHRIRAVAVEVLDSQMLLDPSEEQLDLPAQLVEPCHGQSRDLEMVAQEDEVATAFGIEIADAAKGPGKCRPRFGKGQFADVVATQALLAVDRQGAMAREAQVVLGPRDEEGAAGGKARQPNEV